MSIRPPAFIQGFRGAQACPHRTRHGEGAGRHQEAPATPACPRMRRSPVPIRPLIPYNAACRVAVCARGRKAIAKGPVRTERIAGAVLVAAAALLAAACDRTTPLAASSRPAGTATPDGPGFAQFSDIPIPSGAAMDIERSLVLGERESWIGRVVMTTSEGADRAYDFFFNEMPRFEWQPVTSVRAETSVLTYTRGARVATIQIQGRTIGGARVSVTVSPKGRPAPDAPGALGGGGPITTTPLR